MYFYDELFVGICIFIGMVVYSPACALMGLVGSAGSSLTALALGFNPAVIASGLAQYNAVLSGSAAGGMFFVLNKVGFLMTCFSVIITTVVFRTFANMFSPFGLPALTYPFCVVTMIFLSLGNTSNGFKRVAVSDLTVPERHAYLAADFSPSSSTSTVQVFPIGVESTKLDSILEEA